MRADTRSVIMDSKGTHYHTTDERRGHGGYYHVLAYSLEVSLIAWIEQVEIAGSSCWMTRRLEPDQLEID
jgi:hypothetical protein